MHEAIDYNALGWVRKELGEALDQARILLEEYAVEPEDKSLLQRCAAQLHEALGPLKMVDIKGAVLLATEMEEVVADLLQGSIEQPDNALQELMQSFLQLPDYLTSIRPGRPDKPEALLPLINGLRKTRGARPLERSAVFSPNLSARVPASVFDVRAKRSGRDIQAVARSARVRFQGGLLEWYRNAESSTGLQTLVDTLDEMRGSACTEPVARVWWAGSGVAEALRDGALEVTVRAKQLFGQLDRQIKRLVDAGEHVFDDVLTDELMKNLLFHVALAAPVSEKISELRNTYGIRQMSAEGDLPERESGLLACNDEMLQTVAITLRSDMERIKELVALMKEEGSETSRLEAAAGELHALSNTLGMIGVDEHATAVAAWEEKILGFVSSGTDPDESTFVSLADDMMVVENAVIDIAEGKNENSVLNNGVDAVTREVVASIGVVKEALTDFMQSSGDAGLLAEVPALLGQISGGLVLSGQERAAAATSQVNRYIASELIDAGKTLRDDETDSLADAICSIEFFIEEIVENRSNTGSALDVAEDSLKKLGYPCPRLDEVTSQSDDVQIEAQGGNDKSTPDSSDSGCINDNDPVSVASTDILQSGDEESIIDISGMQVIAADADEEILEIFIEEADEELQKLSAFIPIWVASPEANEYLADIRRSFHTLKGSGRMVGALAVGELAWVFEGLINRVIDGVVEPHDKLRLVLGESVSALRQLMGQITGKLIEPPVDINALAHTVAMCGDPDASFEDVSAAADTVDDMGQAETGTAVADQGAVDDSVTDPVVSGSGISDAYPVLAEDADEEIVEIFLEEAGEEVASVTETMPLWLADPGNEEARATIRRSLHTLKGSGRMAGAMAMGEFAWSVENLVNRVIEGTVDFSDGLNRLMAALPEALSQLVSQIQSGVDPVVDVAGMMDCADALGRGESVIFDTAVHADDRTEAELEASVGNESEQLDVTTASDGDISLLEIFSAECNEHLQSIRGYIEEGPGPREVSESLYRALHTISGISESAEISSISQLAGGLNEYIDAHYHAGQVISQDVIQVLEAGLAEMFSALNRLPDLAIDQALQQQLQEQISALPPLAEELPGTDVPVETDEVATALQQQDDSGDAQVEQDAAAEDKHSAAASASSGQEVAQAPAEAVNDEFSAMDPELYEIFVEEASEIIDSSESVLRSWSEEPGNTDYMTEFQRQLHTIKGGARMMDIQAIGDLSHVLESLMTRISDGLTELSDELFVLMQESHDQLSEMLEQVKLRQMPAAANSLIIRIESLCGIAGDDSLSDTSVAEVEVESADSDAGLDTATPDSARDDTADISCAEGMAETDSQATPVIERHVNENLVLPRKYERKEQSQARGEQVRVQSNVLEDMVNYAGEINIYRSRMEQQVTDYRFNLTELDQTITRLRNQLRQLEMETEAQILYRYEQEGEATNQEFDPLEMDRYSNLQQLSRSLIESISDLRSLQDLMEETTRESETLLLQQSRVSTDLQEGLMRTRMIPFSGLSSRLRRIVRQSARQLGKKVELNLVGADGEMDRTVIDRIIAPLEHMLRNAIAHGIEMPDDRISAGKQETGSITIVFDREGPEIVLRIEDDGAGLDTLAIRARAVERKLTQEDEKLSDSDVMQFILQTGFSTATEVTQISGRGVGMDVVNSEVKQLGGSLHIESTAGQGTLFTIRLPYTLAVNQALITLAGSETFCVPLGSVEGVVRVNNEELVSCYRSGECIYHYAGNKYQLKHLATLLNTGAVELCDTREQAPVLLVRIGEKRIALHVEALLGSREIVIKPVGAQFSTVDCISGATIAGDGSVVMILDMAAISRMNVRADLPETPLEAKQESRLVVMVVDDSITVRKVTSRLLERNGYKVLTAKDGVDAIGQLQDAVPDMMLLDIEMPRMDGFELATHMRNDAGLRHVPIIMITSRTGDKHRERAAQIGVNNYLGKPYQENDLLESIHRIIGVSAEGAVA